MIDFDDILKEAVVYCDGDECSREEIIDGDGMYVPSYREIYREISKELRNSGWKIGRDVNGDWYHLCPDCFEE